MDGLSIILPRATPVDYLKLIFNLCQTPGLQGRELIRKMPRDDDLGGLPGV